MVINMYREEDNYMDRDIGYSDEDPRIRFTENLENKIYNILRALRRIINTISDKVKLLYAEF